jgi:hypothetical protein
MPTEFLTDEQEQAYGHYVGPPPPNAVAYVAAQLDIRDVACLADYAARPATAWEHGAEIRRTYGYCGTSVGSARKVPRKRAVVSWTAKPSLLCAPRRSLSRSRSASSRWK